MTDKKTKSSQTDGEKQEDRRDFLKKMGVAGAVGAATAVGGSMMAKSVHADGLADDAVRFDFSKMKFLVDDPEGCAEYVAAVDEVVEQMLDDPEFANTILENTDGVGLIRTFNNNRKQIEPFIGKIDGRTKAGRYKKLIHASELFHNVSGMDGVDFGDNSEELMVYRAEAGDEAVISSTCSGCSPSDPAVLGCCIVHFWSWSEGGSCSPCRG
jgi:hypothetical protein